MPRELLSDLAYELGFSTLLFAILATLREGLWVVFRPDSAPKRGTNVRTLLALYALSHALAGLAVWGARPGGFLD